VTPRLDEFALMKSGAFFLAALALIDQYGPIKEIVPHPLRVSVPLNIS
jgi:hypothetical protein